MTSQCLARLGRFSISVRIGASIPAACFAAVWVLAIQAQRWVPEPPDAADRP